MKTHFAILACDELEELKSLIGYLRYFILNNDSISVSLDKKNTNTQIACMLDSIQCEYQFIYGTTPSQVVEEQRKTFKDADIIFGLCPDEIPTIPVLQNFRNIFEQNLEIDAMAIPRINIFSNLTKERAAQMYTGHRPQNYLFEEPINEYGWHCWPDYQIRIHKHVPYIYYGDKTHTGLVGYKNLVAFPQDPQYALLHVKSIERQERAIKLYDKIGND